MKIGNRQLKPGDELGDAIKKVAGIYRGLAQAVDNESRLNLEGRSKQQPISPQQYTALIHELAAGNMMARQGLPATLGVGYTKNIPVWSKALADTFAFNLDSHKEIELDKHERIDLMTALKFEGLAERIRLRNKTSIPLMKDYVDSLKYKDNIFSGDTDKLPEHSTVFHLCCEYEKNEEELYTNTSSEDRNEIIADVESSRLAYIQELQKMVDAYNSHSYEVTKEDSIKLQALDEIFGYKNGHIPKLQNQQNANNKEKAGVIETKQELSVSAEEDCHNTKERQEERQQEPRRHIRR